MTIVKFLEARIAEDEEAAKAARPGPWVLDEDEWRPEGPKIGDGALMVPTEGSAPCNDEIPEADSRHIARHDPDRVLRECAAKRAIVDDYAYACDRGVEDSDYDIGAQTGEAEVLGTAVRRLANVYSDHPDFNPSWSL